MGTPTPPIPPIPPIPLRALVLGGRERALEWVVSLSDPDLEAEYLPYEDRIRVIEDIPPRSALRAVIHEVLHYLWDRGNLEAVTPGKLPNGDTVEEFCVQVLSDQIVVFLTENLPHLKALGEALREVLLGAPQLGPSSEKSSVT